MSRGQGRRRKRPDNIEEGLLSIPGGRIDGGERQDLFRLFCSQVAKDGESGRRRERGRRGYFN